ncbi:hypothetical protein [Streptomyces griseus]|uniref:hypothetical protein n=1 Tax=Streptomyces griseus TaxID=1911 RepID=UPI00055DCCE9|nr:hypothetical protein [Streptomyces griseus]
MVVDVLVLSCVLALVIGGCVCVVWAERGGPRWVRAVALVTVALGHLVSGASSKRRSSGGDSSDD